MSDQYEFSSSFFNPLGQEGSPGAVSDEVRPLDNDSNGTPDPGTEADALRRDWLRQHGDIIMPGRCQRPHCGRRRSVIELTFLEEGDVCTTCGYPRVQNYSPVVQCPCLCRCDEDGSTSITESDPMTISDWRIARYDIADREYDPAEDSDSEVDSLPDAESFAAIQDEQLVLTSVSSAPPDIWITDLVFQGRYTRQHMIRAFGFRAYELFNPGWAEEDEFGNIVVHRNPPPFAYNFQPRRRCAYCGLIISDHRDACEECICPLTRNDENNSIEVGPRSSQECACECDCDRDADGYQSSFTSQRAPGQPPRSPPQYNDREGYHDSLSDGTFPALPESRDGDAEVEEVEFHFPGRLGTGWNPDFSFDNSGRGLRILRSGRVYSPAHDPNRVYDIDEIMPDTDGRTSYTTNY
jgi:hypothetical protein